MTVISIIQARMTSTRLPGKVMADLNGRPLLAYMLGRVRRAHRVDAVVVATTDNATDDPVANLCGNLGVPVFRGGEADVLGRFVGAAAAMKADTVVRLTADCPLIDPVIVDDAIALFEADDFDYVSNVINRTYPDGLDVEVFSRAALDRANREATDKFHREHVTTYLRTGAFQDVRTGDFAIGHLTASDYFGQLRWTVDTADDLDRVRALARALPDDHGWMDAIALLNRRPGLMLGGNDADTSLTLRPAGPGDENILLGWVNRPDSLANKLNTRAPISRECHVAWLADRIASDRAGIWIAETGEGPVGQVRLELRDGALEVDIYTDSEHRGRGAALTMLDAARREAAVCWPGIPLLACIKRTNLPSQRLFAKAGYHLIAEVEDTVVLRREALE